MIEYRIIKDGNGAHVVQFRDTYLGFIKGSWIFYSRKIGSDGLSECRHDIYKAKKMKEFSDNRKKHTVIE